MFRAFLSCIFFSLFLHGCGYINLREGDSRFWEIGLSDVVVDSLTTLPIKHGAIEINQMEQYLNKEVDLSSIIGHVEYLPLIFQDKKFIGRVDKIQFNDEFIFILDVFNTKTLNVFDRKSGRQLLAIYSGDESPYGPFSIDDFDFVSNSRRLYLYDNNQSRMMTYTIEGQLLKNDRILFGLQNMVAISSIFVFYSPRDRNVHLGAEISRSRVYVANDSLQLTAHGYQQPEGFLDNAWGGSMFHFRKNGDQVYFMPRFSQVIYEIIADGIAMNAMINFRFGANYLSQEEISSGSERMMKISKDNQSYFSDGVFTVMNNGWVFAAFRAFGHQWLMSFVNIQTGAKQIGTKIGKAPKGMPFFVSPIAAYKNQAVGYLDAESVDAIKKSNQLDKMVTEGQISENLAKIFNDMKDSEDQILVFYNFND